MSAGSASYSLLLGAVRKLRHANGGGGGVWPIVTVCGRGRGGGGSLGWRDVTFLITIHYIIAL